MPGMCRANLGFQGPRMIPQRGKPLRNGKAAGGEKQRNGKKSREGLGPGEFLIYSMGSGGGRGGEHRRFELLTSSCEGFNFLIHVIANKRFR